MPFPLASSLPARALAALGRRSAPAVAASVFVGLALPQLAALAKPLVVPTILALLVLAFVRISLAGAFTTRRAGVAALAIGWIMVALPLALGLVLRFLGEAGAVPLALVMQASAPPIMSAPAFALLLGLDPRLVLVAMLGGMALTPLTAPALVFHFSGGALAIDPLALALRLAAVVGGTMGAGLLVRRLLGVPRVAAMGAHLDGANVLLLGLLAVGLMDGVTEAFLSEPAFMGGLMALAFAVSLLGFGLTALVFRAVDPGDALMLGFAGGHRNVAVLIAATGATLPPEAWLYVAASQFPIYLLPVVLLPLARRIRTRA
ncbi:hypothetical protein ABLE93_05535 [Xanthobacter sp. KR7-65]|uniref:hypothetical protein n=1 Tax=Xanthobacter sp. KR7-65 TaxID=3156612 RepID=UPI0032B6172D